MSLTVASSYNAITFAQQQENSGFATSYFGPHTVSYSLNYAVDTYNMNAVYAYEGTIAASGTETVDLTNVVDVFNNSITLARIYGFSLSTIDADLLITPSAVNGCQWFFNNSSDGIVVKSESNLQYNTRNAYTITPSNCNITLQNQSSTTALTYKIVILGGEGPMTTPTPTSTPVPTATALPTATPVASTTPIPTPIPTI